MPSTVYEMILDLVLFAPWLNSTPRYTTTSCFGNVTKAASEKIQMFCPQVAKIAVVK